jgi:uncharacterized protein (DUF924 family)
MTSPATVLQFWFQEIAPDAWWKADPAFDALIGQRFSSLLRQASRGELFEWRGSALGRLAEIIVLDQFSRNIYRDTPQAFSQDPMSLALAQEAVAAGAHRTLSETERTFLLMPYMHSESKLVHVEAERLFREFTPAFNYEFELKHKAIVDRFGRYPHRNAILGRVSTPEEIEFLKQPGSRF